MFSELFDYATAELCIAVHPFPSVLKAFTDIDAQDSVFGKLSGNSGQRIGVLQNKPLSQVEESDFLLSSTSRSSFTDSNLGNLFMTLTDEDGNTTKLIRNIDSENKSWGVITYLFLIFTILEVLYVTIRGYLVDEENLIRKIITRLLVAGILFLVLMALPALVELFRIGFFSLAQTITAPLVFSDIVEADSVFQLPGGVLRCTSKLLRSMGPDAMGWNLNTQLEKTAMGFPDNFGEWFLKLMMRLLYFILNIFVMVLSLLSAFSIMANIIEVYVLLAIVMCLVPFQVFTGTRYIVGENMIKSLFANIIELFVIMVIIGTTANAAEVIAKMGLVYITNPEYYPVTVTIDTTKIPDEGSSQVFKQTGQTDGKHGLSLIFYMHFDDPEQDLGVQTINGEVVTLPSMTMQPALAKMRKSFVDQYYTNNEITLLNIEKYRSLGQSYQDEATAYPVISGLDGYKTEYSEYEGKKLIRTNSSVTYETGGKTTSKAQNTEQFIAKTMFGYLSAYDFLGLSVAGNTYAFRIRNGFLTFLRNVSANAPSSGYVKKSIQMEASFDASNFYFNSDYTDFDYTYFAEAPIEYATITFAAMLGSSVDDNYKGNGLIDSEFSTFINNSLSVLKELYPDTYKNVSSWDDLDYIGKTELLQTINTILGNAIEVSSNSAFLAESNLNTEAADPSWSMLIMHFFVCIMAAFMQIYFIRKSSSITNALMSGQASMDRMHELTRGITRMAKDAARMPVNMGVGMLGGVSNLMGGGSSSVSGGESSETSSSGGSRAPINDAR